MGFFGELFEELGSEVSGLLSAGRWVTLTNGKRVKLDGDGRIVAGLPPKYVGIHVGDFGRVSKEERELLDVDCEELAACHGCVKTFRTKDQAYRAILDANPKLDALRVSEFGAYDLAFLKWQRNGRHGRKPRTTITDGRLDAINEHYDLKGANRVASFTEAIIYTIPSSMKWADLPPRLEALGAAAGFEINPPDEALRLAASQSDVEQCRADVDARIADLMTRAKETRLEPPPEEGVPF